METYRAELTANWLVTVGGQWTRSTARAAKCESRDGLGCQNIRDALCSQPLDSFTEISRDLGR